MKYFYICGNISTEVEIEKEIVCGTPYAPHFKFLVHIYKILLFILPPPPSPECMPTALHGPCILTSPPKVYMYYYHYYTTALCIIMYIIYRHTERCGSYGL